MHNMIYLTNLEVSEQEFADLVKSLGGYWNTKVDPEHAVVSENTATIYLSKFDDITAEYEPDEVDDLVQQLGEIPLVGVDVHIGHGEGSKELAVRIVNKLIDRWGGIVDHS